MGGCVDFLSGFPRSQLLVRGLHLNVIEMAIASSAQGDDKYVAPSGNQKNAKTGVGHLIFSGIDFSGKHSFCIEDLLTSGGDQPRGVSKISLIILLSNVRGLGNR
ncbi:hypothetical protein L3X38_032447 [Prunus dulcis]|uniref:Uncharacterized protein n=1 Tax=Prunus dulcis TaxID=3755 RepID=A0AAD4VE64_PRUDU|nr:hypothetical protein L3X38_032447 [Prunus dulcis]